MVQLSILVPAADTQSRLDNTLISVLENRPRDCEIVLVHPESYIDPYDLHDEVRLVPSKNAGLLAMINDGIAACRGELVHLLCPGGRVKSGWCEPAFDIFRHDRNLAALAPQLIVGGSVNVHGVAYDVWRGDKRLRARSAMPLMPTLAAGFYQASAFRFMKGFDLRYGALAEVELGFRLLAAGYKTMACSTSQVEMDGGFGRESPTGFLGGQLRARLFQSAKRVRVVSGGSYLCSLLGEFPLHFFRPSVLAAIAGHTSVWFERATRPVVEPFVPLEATRHLTPVPDPELRKAG